MATLSIDSKATLHPRRLVRAVRERGLSGTVALVLSIVACYGTLAAVALLSALGVTLSVNTGLWAGAIVLFALLATAVVGLGFRRHHALAPLVPALAGTALLAYVMFVRFDRVLELVSFVLLAAAVYWDYRLRGRARVPQPK